MNKKQVIKRFCALSSKVMSEKFRSCVPADCFCGSRRFSFLDERVIEFIESAVAKELNKAKNECFEEIK